MCYLKSSLGMIALSFLLFLTSGCSTVESVPRQHPDYRPIAGNSFGYSDRRIKENSYEVTYVGHEKTSQQEASDFALLRGLEIAKKLNYQYLLITSTKDKTSSRSDAYGAYCYPDLRGGKTCRGGGSVRTTFPGVALRLQFFDKRPAGRYLPENLREVDLWYLTMGTIYGLEVKEVATDPVSKRSATTGTANFKVTMNKFYSIEELSAGGWDLSSCSNVPPQRNDKTDNSISFSLVNDTNVGVYDAYVPLSGQVAFLKYRKAGASYKWDTGSGIHWLWFSEAGKCLGWATAIEQWSERNQKISDLIQAQ